MKKKRTAREIETEAAVAAPPRACGMPVPAGEAMAMLVRRGWRPQKTRPDLPFPSDLEPEAAGAISDRLSHYAFRLFLRGAILKPEGFAPSETTRYLKPAQSRSYAESLVGLGITERIARGRYRLIRPARTFGGTLEWYVSHELERRFGFDVAAGVKLHAHGLGGDLDVVAAAEGKLIYLELKSSPPKNLSAGEIAAFIDRVSLIRPDVTVFTIDTALRLSDKVLPMITSELARRRTSVPSPVRIVRECWAITPHIYAVNGRPDLIANIARAIAQGLLALAHPLQV